MKRSTPRDTTVTEGGRAQSAPQLFLDQFVDVLLRERPAERCRWIEAHAREWYLRLPRRGAPPRWTHAVVDGKIVSVR